MPHPPIPASRVATSQPYAPRALVLVAEDEPEIAEILSAYLDRNGLRSIRAADGRQALDLHLSLKPDLVLLDVGMPRLDGWQVLSEIRHRGETPVIMLTAMDQDMDKLTGLRIGADDYIVKPFNPAEVVARVNAVLRRSRPAGRDHGREVIRVGRLHADMESHEIRLCSPDGDQPLTLTLTEFRLLTHLMYAPRRVFSRGELLVACLPEGETLERTVDSHVSKLRKKLEAAGLEAVPASVRGVGYRLGDPS